MKCLNCKKEIMLVEVFKDKEFCNSRCEGEYKRYIEKMDKIIKQYIEEIGPLLFKLSEE